MISETNKDLSLINSVFILRLLSIIGYRPEINECKVCKSKENLTHFSFKNNGFICSNCAKQDKGAIEISSTTKDAIRYIILANAKKYFLLKYQKKQLRN